jgi:hypothetical protein
MVLLYCGQDRKLIDGNIDVSVSGRCPGFPPAGDPVAEKQDRLHYRCRCLIWREAGSQLG